jgi:hypothetical protein
MQAVYSILRRLLLLGAIGPVLSGCFQSDGPKFPPGTAAAPFGDGGLYVVYEYVAIAVSFHTVTEDRFVGQTRSGKDPDDKTYGYLMLRVTGKEALLYLPRCDEQDQATLAAYKVEMLNKLECSIDRVVDPVGLFKALRLGHPVSKLVRE